MCVCVGMIININKGQTCLNGKWMLALTFWLGVQLPIVAQRWWRILKELKRKHARWWQTWTAKYQNLIWRILKELKRKHTRYWQKGSSNNEQHNNPFFSFDSTIADRRYFVWKYQNLIWRILKKLKKKHTRWWQKVVAIMSNTTTHFLALTRPMQSIDHWLFWLKIS